MARYCTLVLYFHSPAARENTAAHSCNIQPYYLLTHQIIYIYIHYSAWADQRRCMGSYMYVYDISSRYYVVAM